VQGDQQRGQRAVRGGDLGVGARRAVEEPVRGAAARHRPLDVPRLAHQPGVRLWLVGHGTRAAVAERDDEDPLRRCERARADEHPVGVDRVDLGDVGQPGGHGRHLARGEVEDRQLPPAVPGERGRHAAVREHVVGGDPRHPPRAPVLGVVVGLGGQGGVLPRDPDLPEVAPAGPVGEEQEPVLTHPARLLHRHVLRPGDDARVDQGPVGGDARHPEPAAVPGHVRVVPGHPGQSRPVRGEPVVEQEVGGAVDVRGQPGAVDGPLPPGDRHRPQVLVRPVEREPDQRGHRLQRGVALVLAQAPHDAASPVDAEAGEPDGAAHVRGERHRVGGAVDTPHTLRPEVDVHGGLLVHAVRCPAVLVEPGAHVVLGRREVHRPVAGIADQRGAAVVVGADVEPEPQVAGRRAGTSASRGPEDVGRRERGGPGAVLVDAHVVMLPTPDVPGQRSHTGGGARPSAARSPGTRPRRPSTRRCSTSPEERWQDDGTAWLVRWEVVPA
jgi:hypothetical protein